MTKDIDGKPGHPSSKESMHGWWRGCQEGNIISISDTTKIDRKEERWEHATLPNSVSDTKGLQITQVPAKWEGLLYHDSKREEACEDKLMLLKNNDKNKSEKHYQRSL